MYKLVIVDDEEVIREGLSSIVDWDVLGFDLVQSVESGEEAIEYICKSEVDVVLTDIKMTFMSGLELTSYIFENKPHIKVVIISGYKEFEIARQALMYNVKNYLLKPMKIIEINNVFKAIKKELDEERNEKAQIKSRNMEYQQLQAVLQEQFCLDIINSRIFSKAEMDRRLKQLGFKNEHSQSSLCVISIPLKTEGNESINYKELENTGICDFLRSMLSTVKDGIHYFAPFSPVIHEKMIAIAPAHMEQNEFNGLVEKHLSSMTEKIKSSIGINSKFSVDRFFSSVYDAVPCLDSTKDDDGSCTKDSEEMKAPVEKVSTESIAIGKAKNYMEKNFDKQIGLEKVAEIVFLNPIYFSRLFKKETGKNFTEYLMDIRVTKAKELLKNPVLTVYEVGAMTGYRNTKYFYRIFKGITGCTPKEYREIEIRKDIKI